MEIATSCKSDRFVGMAIHLLHLPSRRTHRIGERDRDDGHWGRDRLGLHVSSSQTACFANSLACAIGTTVAVRAYLTRSTGCMTGRTPTASAAAISPSSAASRRQRGEQAQSFDRLKPAEASGHWGSARGGLRLALPPLLPEWSGQRRSAEEIHAPSPGRNRW